MHNTIKCETHNLTGSLFQLPLVQIILEPGNSVVDAVLKTVQSFEPSLLHSSSTMEDPSYQLLASTLAMHHPGVVAKQNSGMSAVTLGKVPGSGLGIPDSLAAALGMCWGQALGSLMELQQHFSLEFWLWLERDALQLNCVPVVRPANELG